MARRRDGARAFIKDESDENSVADSKLFKRAYFNEDYFLSLADFKKELGRWFGLRITDAEENLTDRKYRGSKDASPSIRSFASFLLQHQNLVANKHAIFYRFDEKEKREQAIEHFKVFAGFADQTYFIKSQELNELKASERVIGLQIPKASDLKKKAEVILQSALADYVAISGNALEIGNISDVVSNPRPVLDVLRDTTVSVVAVSDEHVRLKQELERERSRLIGELRRAQQKLSAIRSSMEFAKSYTDEAGAVSVPTEAELHASRCPFCYTHYSTVEREANKLNDAIVWLNEELGRSKYLFESFEEQEQKTIREVKEKKVAVDSADEKIANIDKQIVELERYKTQYELALKSKLRIEAVLEQLLERPDQKIEEQLKEIQGKIAAIVTFLKEHYDIEKKLRDAEREINSYMSDLGGRFEFEDSYRPINLHFSLDTFDLWHASAERKVFLRSMGSGANWLYCHITLFLALHRYFCRLGDRCSIPSILFFDQPSQVYFPSVLDTGNEFSPQELADKEGNARKRPVDDDIKAVTNLYSQLLKYCEETLKETGIEPQIIVTDHADNLTLDGGIPFESLVQNRRWRTRGFIEINNTNQTQ
ncbi:MAG: DUF3732 domain-containing protein [Nitrospirae bacterium]|nr:DUF3732 domain-containing protein [Nitrospirota bacterium]